MKRLGVIILAVGLIVSCNPEGPFSLQVVPSYMEAVVGQRCVFLVELAEDGRGDPVEISASVEGADVIVEFSPLDADGVAEVTIIPDSTSLTDTIWGDSISVCIRGIRGEFEDSVSTIIYVIPGEDGRLEYATQVRDSFIRRLEDDFPELGIDDQIAWTPTIVRPRILVVSHYLFFSDEWEMWVDWHNTIHPYDWTRTYLRRRGQEMTPSYSFEIASQTEWGDAYQIDPPDSVVR